MQVYWESYNDGIHEIYYLVITSKNRPKWDFPSSPDDIWVQAHKGELKALWTGGPNWGPATLRSKHPHLDDMVLINDGGYFKWASRTSQEKHEVSGDVEGSQEREC